MYAISVMFDVDPDHAGDFLKAARVHAANSLDEEGCLAFEVLRARDDPARFFFYESYVDRRAVEEVHNKQPYFAEFGRKVSPWILNRRLEFWLEPSAS